MERPRILVVVAAALLSSAALRLPAAGPEGGGPRKQSVLVAEATETEDVHSSRHTGMVESPAVVQVVSRVSGELIAVGFKDGSQVKKGQVLYRLDPTRYKAAVLSAEAGVAECQAAVDYAQKDCDRNKALHAKGVVTQDELESVASTLEIKKANLLAAKASLVLAEDDLKNTTIEAPMDGWIGRSSYTLGNYITPSSGVLATIIHVDRMRVRFSISNRDFLSGFGTVKRLGEDGVVRITLADGSEYPVKGEVEFVNNEANERTDSIQVYASLANPDRKLIAGGAVTVTLAQSRGKMLPAVLPSAVMHDSRGSYVYVVGPGNKAEKRSVVLGSSRTDLQIIKSGIEVGTLVIVDGTHKAVDGAEVEPIRQER